MTIGGQIGESIEQETEQKQKEFTTSFWTYSFYQQFFDVDSSHVLSRIVKTVVPWKPNFLQLIKTNPDL
jgi:protein YIPF1/2